jgi:hypothetical protein
MMGFMREHVAKHFQADWPSRRQGVSAKHLDAAAGTAERFSQHLNAASGAFGQRCAGLRLRAAGAVELEWDFQMRSGEPDPLGSDVVHVGEDGHNGAGLAGRFGFPGGGIKMLDEQLVRALVGGEDLDSNLSEWRGSLRARLAWARGHGSRLLDPGD